MYSRIISYNKKDMAIKGETVLYKKQEKMLIWISFIVAGIMLLSILGRMIGH